MGAGSQKKGKITCLVFIFFLSLQQNKVFKKNYRTHNSGWAYSSELIKGYIVDY